MILFEDHTMGSYDLENDKSDPRWVVMDTLTDSYVGLPNNYIKIGLLPEL